MKIAFDVSPLQYRQTGVSRYIEQLTLNLLKIDRQNQYTFFYNSFTNRFSQLANYQTYQQFPNLTVKEFYLPEKLLHRVWNDWHLFPVERLLGQQDVFYYSDWFTPPFSGKKITTVHDLTFRQYPETVDQYVLATQKKRFAFLQREDFFLVADSEATKKDLLREGFREQKIAVVYPGVNVKTVTQEFADQTLTRYHLVKPFILTVGKIEPRKNYQRLIDAFVQGNYWEIELVIVGNKGWGQKLNFPQKANIQILATVTDEELSALYQNALFFIMPSLYEGFGFPALEAMALSCPTALSSTSSLFELGQNASCFFNPLSIQELKKTLTLLINDSQLRNKLIEEGRQKVKNFGWEKTAKQILTIINKL